MKISARILLLIFFLASFVFLFSNQTFAQTVDPQPSVTAQSSTVQPSTSNPLNTNPDVDKNLHNGVQVVMIETMSAMLCQLSGHDFINPNHKCLGVDPQSGRIGFVDGGGGMVSVMATLIGYTFVPPASGAQYISYLQKNFGIAKSSYAKTKTTVQVEDCTNTGLGFCGLSPVLNLWLIMRNLVYLIFIVIFIVIGLAIMFRIHIDPRTVMTVQNQIPKIIIGIVLVTFSFSIAGFLIDTMYVSSYLLGSVLSQAQPDSDGDNLNGYQRFEKVLKSNSPIDAANQAYEGGTFAMMGDGINTVSELVNSVFFGPSSSKDAFTNKLGGDDPVTGVLRIIITGIITILATLIIFVGVLFVLIRIWVVLIFAYINILLDIIFAPFWFIIGLVPGSSLGIGAWFRDMIANLAVYPATIAMLMLANIFAHAYKNAPSSQNLFVPPLLGNPQNAGAISGIIGLGFLFMLPNVLTIMKGALKAPKIDLGPVFKPAAVGAGVITKLPKKGFEVAERYRYAKSTGESSIFGMARNMLGNPLMRPVPPKALTPPENAQAGPGAAGGEGHPA